jgi:hypothetical protein
LAHSEATLKRFWKAAYIGGRDHTDGLQFKVGEEIVASASRASSQAGRSSRTRSPGAIGRSFLCRAEELIG